MNTQTVEQQSQEQKPPIAGPHQNGEAPAPGSDLRKRVVRLLALWGAAAGSALRGASAKEKRYERLRFCAQQVGRVIDSANDLTEEELGKCIQALQQSRDRKGAGAGRQKKPPIAGAPGSDSNVVEFPNTSGITEGELWKIWQLEHFLGWAENPARLEGLLRAKFHEANPKYLSHAQAWRAIETLFSIAAREEAKKQSRPSTSREEPPLPRGRGSDSRKVSPEELKAARARLKKQLETWRPEETEPQRTQSL
jgi:hypothetical protein